MFFPPLFLPKSFPKSFARLFHDMSIINVSMYLSFINRNLYTDIIVPVTLESCEVQHHFHHYVLSCTAIQPNILMTIARYFTIAPLFAVFIAVHRLHAGFWVEKIDFWLMSSSALLMLRKVSQACLKVSFATFWNGKEMKYASTFLTPRYSYIHFSRIACWPLLGPQNIIRDQNTYSCALFSGSAAHIGLALDLPVSTIF